MSSSSSASKSILRKGIKSSKPGKIDKKKAKEIKVTPKRKIARK
jgi:hypothetical protein